MKSSVFLRAAQVRIDLIGYYANVFVMLLRGTLYQIIRFQFRGWLLLGRGGRVLGLSSIKFKGVVKVGAFSTLDARFCDRVILGDRVSIGDFSIIRASGSHLFRCSHLILGRNVTFGPFCNIGGGFGLEVGDHCIFGPYVSVHPEEHYFNNLDIPIRDQGVFGSGIKIGSNNWVGAKATILDGAVIQNGCVVVAGSLLLGRLYESDGVYVGSPCRFVRSRV